MSKREIYLGSTSLNDKNLAVKGEFISIQKERYFKISNFNRMPDFFMTLVSDSDHWIFISSNGSLSAGRRNRDKALFPYYSDDKIHDYCGITGSITICLVESKGRTSLWEPFSKQLAKIYRIERNLYKSVYGNQIIFEEINHDLGLSFRYSWSNSEQFGFVKQSGITNITNEPVKVELLDGIRNILPSGIDYIFQNEYSNLSDAYKKAELIEETGLGIFMLSSIPVDRAEPSESLYATTVWSSGLVNSKILISDHQLAKFKQGFAVTTETDIRASRGAYYVNAELTLKKQQTAEWMTVAEINQSTTDVANLNLLLKNTPKILSQVHKDIEAGTKRLVKIVAAADGLQTSNEELCCVRHFTNTLFNVMRGGVYQDDYTLDSSDFRDFVNLTNTKISNDFKNTLDALPKKISNSDLIQLAEKKGNAHFIRICYEYLPLTFSRRHGDPSRPWNQFSIDNKNEDGSPKLDFQGNWRDIFQNWEALSVSYPGFIESIISKFVNASTPDGYNPYRIMRSGIDWESPDPDDPWAYIGYWGDHQIIYLQKLLELSDSYHPGKLDELLRKEIFAYANVPYRIKSYKDIVSNPQDTIYFDHELNNHINNLVKLIGADGRLLLQNGADAYQVNLTEKILVTLLVKLSNFIPEAGIWLNTQRPEWNDANNALVGNGTSMVTVYYLRRFLKFWNDKFKNTSFKTVEISEEVNELFDIIFSLFAKNTGILKNGFSEAELRYFTDNLGEAGAAYRNKIYKNSFTGIKKTIQTSELIKFTQLTLEYIDQSIRVNKRKDGLYHAYNLISLNDNSVKIRHLYEMLEGQVAVLSAGILTSEESLELLNTLKESALFREDQYSYLLYPDRQLKRFSEKNNIPVHRVKESQLLSKLIANKNNSIISKDQSGNYHFNGTFRNAKVLNIALSALETKKYGRLVKKEKSKILSIYEEMFDHQSFTGRSGTFYGYEGLGSIYWHMVSKLLLATQECFFNAAENNADPMIIEKLKDHYYEIKAGIGIYKSPELYGAFPTDPYSHTPGNAGVKQPGMTGQVKEDIISRMLELGVQVINGAIVFNTSLINPNEILSQQAEFEYFTMEGKPSKILMHKNQLAYTFCQTPVVYTFTDHEEIVIFYRNRKNEKITGHTINKKTSNLIFKRSGEVLRIEVSIKH